MSEVFKGRLRAKNPKDIIKESSINELDDFFLTLALVFNDLKGMIFFQNLISNNYAKPDGSIDVHNGELGGLKMQIIRIISVMINEFLDLIKTSPIIETEEFKNRLEDLKPEDKDLWTSMIAIANQKQAPENEITYALKMIRGNITAHYKNAGKNLRRGFVVRFYKKKRDRLLKNLAAYFSLEDTLQNTRLYYADAAAEEYMMLISSNWGKYQQSISELVRAIHKCIYVLMINYLKERQDIKPPT